MKKGEKFESKKFFSTFFSERKIIFFLYFGEKNKMRYDNDEFYERLSWKDETVIYLTFY